jgi:UDP-N-acetylglucosamine 4-epimerase
MFSSLQNKTILVTGGAGFIGSNLCEALLKLDVNVRCLDNLETGFMHNIEPFLNHKNFQFIQADIRDLEACQNACYQVDYVLHQAALGSVPRSIKDPITTNAVNVDGFLNMLVASRDQKVKRFVYAASSSTYGDSNILPKKEDEIGTPLSPYAITKYVNELYATIFKTSFNLDTVGLRYFNVFGRKQDPKGAYAAVIPKFVIQLINHESPTINGDGSNSRDFTYIDNVIRMNLLALSTKTESALNQKYNTAVGDRTTLVQLVHSLKKYLSKFDTSIVNVKVIHGPDRLGDIPHSQASIDKAVRLLNYKPTHSFESGLENAVEWYWEQFKS